MKPLRLLFLIGTSAIFFAPAARADQPFADIADQVNKKLVKLFGSGGFRGLASYGSGMLVSPDGYVLTVATHLIETQDLRVHLYDGRRYQAKVIVSEPELDVALLKLENVEDLPYFDIPQAGKRPLAQAGDWVLAFSNQFQIATRDEPMSVQRGVIASHSKLHGRRGIHEAVYQGDVYVIDAITNNPGAGGGVITTRKGELLGIIGRELRNSLTETWINYAVPIAAKVEIREAGDKLRTVSIPEFVDQAMRGKYKPIQRKEPREGPGGYHGIVLVPNVVDRTPPFIEDILPGSPAAKAGLRPDDLIVYVDGEQVISVKAFNMAMSRIQPGQTVTLEIRRSDRESKAEKLVTVKLPLTERPKPKR
ncbi:MAG TPA: trypsin-like peptidase domain-containing protein [Gemmataceae bacterium]|nr:trypsin-like peptidase domain-containing protein [Gemmataceae bacterium]